MSIKEYEMDGFSLGVGEGGALRFVFNNNSDECGDFTIPHVLPDGEFIHFIAPFSLAGHFSTLTISDGIDFVKSSLSGCRIDKVIWPSSCDYIPETCFYESSVKEIDNIDHVTNIGKAAFSRTKCLEHISWPKNCSSIPIHCFSYSSLKSIDIGSVSEIGGLAFAFADNIESIDLSNSLVNVIGERAFYGLSREKVSFPYYLNMSSFFNIF